MRERTILWIFLAFIVGFALPVCSCLGTGFVTIAALGSLVEGGTPSIGGEGDAVAVIRLEGVISSDSDSFTVTGIAPDVVADLLEQADQPAVKAIVIHVNSPGGSVVASDRIYHMLLEIEKPVVIWMDEMAASGGYYIACAGDHIIAHPDTLTGSIGVISQFINAEELLDKIGVNVVVITSGPHKDIGSSFREMTEEERALWQGITDEIYESFVTIVAEARGLSPGEVRELADGRVYTGRQALEAGLVDGVGSLDDAIAKAGEMGGIVGKPRVIELKRSPTFMEALYGFQGRAGALTFEEILNEVGVPRVEYRLTR